MVTFRYYCSICIMILLLFGTVQKIYAGSAEFEAFGDAFQIIIPLTAALVSISAQDWKGLGQLATSYTATMGTVYVLKYGLGATKASFTKRPSSGATNGFPSGHTASAFVGAAYLQRRYGWKAGLPAIITATAVGISRVDAKKHTILQVVAGAVIAYCITSLATSPREMKGISLVPYVAEEESKPSFGMLLHVAF